MTEPTGTTDVSRCRATIIGCAAAGFAIVAVPLVSYGTDTGGSPALMWDAILLGLPIVALAGGFAAPSRRRAVVVATTATWVLLVTVSKLMALLRHPLLLAWMVVPVLLSVAMATVGQWLKQRSAGGRPTPAPAG